MIPKVINQIWIGKNSIKDEHALFVQKWKDMYPDFDHIFWDNERVKNSDIIPADKTPYFYSDHPIAFKADLLRYEIIKRYGGIYIDVDTEPLKRMDDSIFEHSFFSGIQPGEIIAIGIFGAEPRCPLMIQVCDELVENTNNHISTYGHIKYVDQASGPIFFTRICDRFKDDPSYYFAPMDYFYPYSWDTPRPPDCKSIFPKAYSVHHWTMNWHED